jgi:cytosine/uracil/thiamine/allantoin permease
VCTKIVRITISFTSLIHLHEVLTKLYINLSKNGSSYKYMAYYKIQMSLNFIIFILTFVLCAFNKRRKINLYLHMATPVLSISFLTMALYLKQIYNKISEVYKMTKKSFGKSVLLLGKHGSKFIFVSKMRKAPLMLQKHTFSCSFVKECHTQGPSYWR